MARTHLGLVGQVATSWGVTGGLTAAVVVTGHVFFGRLSASLGFLTTTVFFLGGSVIGYLHGGILGYLGRPPDVDRRLALRRLGQAALYAVPAMIVGWLAAMLIALSAASVLAGRPVSLAVSLLGWIAAVAVLAWTVFETREAVRHLCRRWPDARAVLVTIGLAFLALLPVFLVTRPEVWVVGVTPTATTAGIMALAAAVWILGPLSALALLGFRAWSRHHPSHTPESSHGPE